MSKKILVLCKQVFFACSIITQVLLMTVPARVARADAPPEPSAPIGLIITSVQITGGTGHTQEDFIELFNPTSNPVDLNGFRLVKRTAVATTDTIVYVWSESTIVQPHHFYLWANSTYTTLIPLADATSAVSIADNNGVALRLGPSDSGTLVDSFAWGSTTNGFKNISLTNAGANLSLHRDNLFADPAIFSILPSSPRNITIELSPVVVSPPVINPPVVDPPFITPQPVINPPPVIVPPTGTTTITPSVSTTEMKLQITEIYPNPPGADSGFEQIELYNAGHDPVNLKNFKLDDIISTDTLTSNSLSLDEQLIAPDSYIVITIPIGKFSLNNTGGDVVTLFDEKGKVLDSAFYQQSAPEGKSWSYFDNGWAWTIPSLGDQNVLIIDEKSSTTSQQNQSIVANPKIYDNTGLVISEIYPLPNKGEQEFVELFNSGEETSQLSQVDLYAGTRHGKLLEKELKPGEYFLLTGELLPIQLRNNGQELKLQQGTQTIYKVSYPTAIKGASYSLFEDGFLWTTTVTKAAENLLHLPDEVIQAAAKEAQKTQINAKNPILATQTSNSSAYKTPSAKTGKKTPVTPTNNSSSTINGVKAGNSEIQPNSASSNHSLNTKGDDSLAKIIAMGAAAVTAGIIAIYKFVLSPGIE